MQNQINQKTMQIDKQVLNIKNFIKTQKHENFTSFNQFFSNFANLLKSVHKPFFQRKKILKSVIIYYHQIIFTVFSIVHWTHFCKKVRFQ